MELYEARRPRGCLLWPTVLRASYTAYYTPVRRRRRWSSGLRTVLIRANGRLSYVFRGGLAFDDAVGGIIQPAGPADRQTCLSTAKAKCRQWMMVINGLIPGAGCFYVLPYMQYALDGMQ